jgi:cytidylate kinase
MYRAVALFCTERGAELSDAAQVAAHFDNLEITLRIENGVQRIFLNSRDVTEAIRTQAVSEGASVVAAHAFVRERLVAEQQKMATCAPVVMDGRDIGSRVLPGAEVKIYLDASLETRSRRRMMELENRGQPADFETIRAETLKRDTRDKTRTAGPLIRVADAVLIDTGMMRPDEVADAIIQIVRERSVT